MRISSICLSFNNSAGIAIKTVVLKSRTSNHVAVFSVWEKGSILDEPYKRPKVLSRKLLDSFHAAVLRRPARRSSYSLVPPLLHVDAFEKALSAAARLVDVSWYEVSCWDCKERTPLSPFSLPTQVYGKAQQLSSLVAPLSSTLSPTLSHSLSCWDSTTRMPSPLVSTLSLPPLAYEDDEQLSLSSRQSSSRASSSSLSPSLASSRHLSVGDIVHLKCIASGKPCLEDVLSYSCLAILKAYFPHTDGLLSYAFYRSLNGSRMAAMGVWESFDAASTFLHAPNGAHEERYWRSLGAKTRFGIYEVVALVTE